MAADAGIGACYRGAGLPAPCRETLTLLGEGSGSSFVGLGIFLESLSQDR